MLLLLGAGVALVASRLHPPSRRPQAMLLQSREGQLVIPFADVRQLQPRFFETARRQRLMVFRDERGAARAALDRCKTCNNAEFRLRKGQLICSRCDLPVRLTEWETAPADCLPVSLPLTERWDGIVLLERDLAVSGSR
jgi:uncharacterized membrane protein